MARLSTCKGCGEKLQPEEKYTHGSKTYCKSCLTEIQRKANEYKELIEFICVNYGLEKPTGLILKQIHEMKNECNYSHAAMTYTLWYCKEILGKEMIPKYGVALIKHYYEEAKEYYSQQEKMKQRMSEISEAELKTKLIKQKRTGDVNKPSSLIDLNHLLGGGGVN